MSTKDFIKKSVLNAFIQYDAPKLAVALLAALALGILIYLVYRKFYTGVVYSRSFAVTLVGMCVLTCMVTLAISTNVVISLGMRAKTDEALAVSSTADRFAIIGDCKKPATVQQAMRQAYATAMRI